MRRLLGLVFAGVLWLGQATTADAQFALSLGGPFGGGLNVGSGYYPATYYSPYGYAPAYAPGYSSYSGWAPGYTSYSSGYAGYYPVAPAYPYPRYYSGYRYPAYSTRYYGYPYGYGPGVVGRGFGRFRGYW